MTNAKRLAIALLIFAGFAAGAESKSKALYRVLRFNDETVAVSCVNGQIPTITPAAGRIEESYVIVSCH